MSTKIKHLEKHLNIGELIASKVKGTFEADFFGNKMLKTGYLVATNQRLLFYRRGLFGINEELRVFPYDKITSIRYKSGVLGETITFTASGSTMNVKHIKSGQSWYVFSDVSNRINK